MNTLEERLMNWGRYIRSDRKVNATWLYRAILAAGEAGQIERPTPINVRDAEAVNDAWRNLPGTALLDFRAKHALVVYYAVGGSVDQMLFHMRRRGARVTRREFDTALEQGRILIARRLQCAVNLM